MANYKATRLIMDAFDEKGVKYQVVGTEQEDILASFGVDNGPSLTMKFISRDDDNDLAIRIFGLLNNVPENKRSRAIEACNVLNARYRFMKFYCDSDGDVNLSYDFPVAVADECVGAMAFEIFLRAMKMMDEDYSIFMKALYTNEPLEI